MNVRGISWQLPEPSNMAHEPAPEAVKLAADVSGRPHVVTGRDGRRWLIGGGVNRVVRL